jgi:hypothetical protein
MLTTALWPPSSCLFLLHSLKDEHGVVERHAPVLAHVFGGHQPQGYATHPPPECSFCALSYTALRVATGLTSHTLVLGCVALRCVCAVRAWLFVAFAIGFGAIGASIWMCVDSYQHESGSKMWPGTPQNSLQ